MKNLKVRILKMLKIMVLLERFFTQKPYFLSN